MIVIISPVASNTFLPLDIFLKLDTAVTSDTVIATILSTVSIAHNNVAVVAIYPSFDGVAAECSGISDGDETDNDNKGKSKGNNTIILLIFF